MISSRDNALTQLDYQSPGFIGKLLRTGVINKLKGLKHGSITLKEGKKETLIGDPSGKIQVDLVVYDPQFFWDLSLRGSIGAAESYVLKRWGTSNLVDVIRLFALNRDYLNSLEGGFAALQRPLRFLQYLGQSNTKSGSKTNIRAHYDISDDLFKEFLDEKMMYSSAYYPHEKATLEEAQEEKLRIICKKLDLRPEDHLLEIGTGWGGLAIYAASNFGCRVTTTTISENQYQEARKRIHDLDLQEKITLLKSDYRDLTGTFDKIVSIEMIEAVGEKFLPTYMSCLSKLLKPDGQALLQAIVINDQEYERAVKEVDFIKKYIFPGSFIPGLHAILGATKDHTDLRLYHMEDFTPHYAQTLLDWRSKFLNRSSKISEMGHDETFQRMWDFYFSYCAGGFLERAIGVVHLEFGKPQFRKDLTRLRTI